MDKYEKLPWKDKKEFYEIHSKEIFSLYPIYHISMIGKNKYEFLEYITKKARIYPKAKILDLGCGSGFIVNSLNQYCECIGISTSEECIKQCKINHPLSKFEIANMENYISENCTHILALESLGYSNVEKTFETVSKNLKKVGYFT